MTVALTEKQIEYVAIEIVKPHGYILSMRDIEGIVTSLCGRFIIIKAM